MTNIIELPGRDERTWLDIEGQFDKELLKHGLPEEMRNDILESVKRVYETHCKSHQIPMSYPPWAHSFIRDAVSAVSSHYRDIVSALMFEILIREMRLSIKQNWQ
jgi:hypothetical protein